MGFGQRILLTVLASLLLATLLFTVLVTWFTHDNSRQQLLAQQQDISQMVVRRLDSALQERRVTLERFAELLTDEGQLLEPAQLREVLDNRIQLHNFFNGGMVVLNHEGVSIADSPLVEGRSGIDFSDRPHVRQVRATMATVMTRPLLGRGLQEPVFVINAPIIAEGELLGFIFGVTRLADDNLFKALGEDHYGRQSRLWVVDEGLALIVTASDPKLAMQPVAQGGLLPMLQKIRQEGPQGYAEGPDGEAVLYTAVSLPGMGWQVIHTLPEALLVEPIRQLLRQLTLLIAALMLPLALATWWVLRRPLLQLRDTAEQIDRMVAEHTSRLTIPPGNDDEIGKLIRAFNRLQGRLARHIEGLEQHNRELHRLSEVTAHHLMEPSRRLLVFSDRLQSQLAGKCTQEQALELGYIHQAASRLRDLVRDMQRYLAAGEQLEAAAEQDPNTVVSEVLGELARQWPERYASAQIRIDRLPPLWIDRSRLVELYRILLENAFCHGQTQRPLQLHLGVYPQGEHSIYYVDDNGPGIASHYHERLFAIFEHLGGEGHGTGIGLAIARRIVDSLGGRIWIESNESGGTRVCFTWASDGEVEHGIGQ